MRMPWRKPAPGAGDAPAKPPEGQIDRAVLDGFVARLRERGVTETDAADLARRLAPELLECQPSARAAYLDGVAASVRVTQEARVELDRSLTDIKEVERLMGAFSGELSKLDEVLEVLAAYVRRMRTSNGETSAGQTLH